MKLPELKKCFQNKYVIRIAAGVLTVAMLGTGAAIYSGRSDVARAEVGTESVGATETKDDTEAISVEDVITRKSSSDVDKEETVYLISDANGKVKETIVTDHLFNPEGRDTLEDQTDLKEIKNTKGEETFDQNGEKLTWKADGNDIYYRGKRDGEAPVSQKVTYYLDDQEIAPEDLAGKSGKVRIHFQFENKSAYEATVNGEKIQTKVPFMTVTALMLNEDFTNVKVTNGKVKSNGDKNIVIGTTLPGLQKSLDLSGKDLTDGKDFPEDFEMTADVKDFKLTTAMTVVVNATEFADMEAIDTGKLDDKIEEIEKASGKLEDGSGDLADGLGKLDEKLGTFSDGMKTLRNGLEDYTEGADKIDGGIGKVKKGVDTLDKSKGALASGVGALKKGTDTAAAGAKKLAAGYKGDGTAANPGLLNGTKQLSEGVKTLGTGINTLKAGMDGDEKTNNTGLVKGSRQVSDGADALNAGIGKLMTGIEGDGTAANPGLVKGAENLASGAKEVDQKMTKLAEGADSLDKGVDQLVGTMSGISDTLKAKVQKTLDDGLNKDASTVGLLKAFGFEDGVTIGNVDTVIDTFQTKKAQVVGAIAQGAAAKGADEAQAKAIGEENYAKLMNGLYKAQGAVGVAEETAGYLSSDENKEKLQKLAKGSEDLKNGAQKLQSEGTAVLSQGAENLSNGAKALDSGAKEIQTGTIKLAGGAKAVSSGADKVSAGVNQLSAGAAALGTGATNLYSGAGALSAGTASLSEGLGKLDGGITRLYKKIPTLTKGIGKLKGGVDQLAAGSGKLVGNNAKLMKGSNDLLNGTKKITDGVDKLDDGSHKLEDGMKEFNEKAIQKLVNSYNGDVKSLLNNIQATLDAGHDYQTWSQTGKGQSGSVKFIYKLDSIEK